MKLSIRKLIPLIIIAAIILAGYLVWTKTRHTGPGEGFVSGNGRIEATEINISAKLAGRIEEILVREGDFVTAGQTLVRMQTDTLAAQLNEARAQLQQAVSNEANAKAQVAQRVSDKAAAEAMVVQRESDLNAANKRLARSSVLHGQGAMPVQEFDDDEAAVHSARAAVVSAKAQADVAQAAIDSARASVDSVAATIKANEATIARIEADIADSALSAPTGGRIQYRIAQPGEVMGAGGKVLNLVDLADVYLTFFLPETVAGQVALQQEVRLVLDAAPERVIPAYVSYVASVAQFTPKTVETESERQKLMFRVKAQIPPQLLTCFMKEVKTGLPGVAWVRLDADKPWPTALSNLVQECGGERN